MRNPSGKEMRNPSGIRHGYLLERRITEKRSTLVGIYRPMAHPAIKLSCITVITQAIVLLNNGNFSFVLASET